MIISSALVLAAGLAVPAASGAWVPAAQIPVTAPGVRYAPAQCDAQSFYTMAGRNANTGLTNDMWRYDAAADSWTRLADFPFNGEGGSAVCYQGRIYALAGGHERSGFVYDVATNVWIPNAGPTVPTSLPVVVGAAMGAWNGKLYRVGGDDDSNVGNGVSNMVAIYDIANGTWTGTGTPMPTGTVFSGYAQVGQYLYVVGGWNAAAPANVTATQRYDMAANTWSTGPAFTGARADLSLAATTTALYAIGGDANGGSLFEASVEVDRLDITSFPNGAWTAWTALPAPTMSQKGGFCTSAIDPAAGEIWLTGGTDAGGFFPVRVNQYLPAERCPLAAAIAPSALAVDAAGNGVFEPNEGVVVAPSWRNTGTVATSSLTGAATNFTGPAGATYVMTDGAANYGPAAPGATTSCAATGNCYAFSVAATTRPVTHWDTTFTETVAALGQVKDWKLHIGASFTDVPPSSGFYRFVETILHKNVTGGCAANTYCPSASTTREQMAVFVLVAKEPAGYAPPFCAAGGERFTDVPAASPFCKWVEELERRGVVGGCTASTYCPNAPATREQMAVFVLRTLDPALSPPACVAPMFADVPAASPFCKWIEELVRRGVVTGCGGGNYCPTANVTREQMGVFLTVTFGLVLYGV